MPISHDSLFKGVFSDPKHAEGALKAVMPPQMAAALHWPALTLCSGSFIDEVLRPRHTDLLFSTTWIDGSDTLLYLLFEHQSSPDPDMAFRLLRYQMRAWDRWRQDHPDRRLVPVMIPIVLYHGTTPWPGQRSFADALDASQEMLATVGPHVVQFHYLVDDLSSVPDEVLRQRAMTALGRLAEVCFKHARHHADPLAAIRDHLDIVREVVSATNGLRALGLVVRYILEVHKVDREALTSIIDVAIGPEGKDTVMTTADELRLEGRQEGLQEGLKQGKQDTLLRQLRKRFGDAVDVSIEQRVGAASTDQLEVWADRVLDARTLGDVLAD